MKSQIVETPSTSTPIDMYTNLYISGLIPYKDAWLQSGRALVYQGGKDENSWSFLVELSNAVDQSFRSIALSKLYQFNYSDLALTNIILRQPNVWFRATTAQGESETRTVLNDQILQEIFDEVNKLASIASDDVFEDGMESECSRGLISLVGRYGSAAVRTLATLIINERLSVEFASMALKQLGHIQDDTTYYDRIWLLEKALLSRSPRIRDAALLGLASLDDPNALPYIERAIRVERIGELRNDMQQVVYQLKATEREQS